MNARQQLVIGHFVSAGYPAISAAAVVGNGCQESGVNLDSTFLRLHADHNSGAFLEWRDSQGSPRKTRLGNFADAKGISRDDLMVQCDYCIWELETYFPALNAQLKNPGNRPIENLVANFCDEYENPNPAVAGLDNRIAHARQALADWEQNQREIQNSTATVIKPPIVAPTIPPIPQSDTLPSAEITNLEVNILSGFATIIQRYDERIAADQKKRDWFAQELANFSKMLPESQTNLNLIPTSPPALPGPQTKGNPMQNILGANWKTTLSGLIAAASQGIGTAFPQYSWLTNFITPLAISALGATAKDMNVTGGTVPNNTSKKI